MQEILENVGIVDLRVIHDQETETAELLFQKSRVYDQIDKHDIASATRRLANVSNDIAKQAKVLIDGMIQIEKSAIDGASLRAVVPHAPFNPSLSYTPLELAMSAPMTARYNDPESSCVGYIQPSDRSWIAFVMRDRHGLLYMQRDPKGGIMGDGIKFMRDTNDVEPQWTLVPNSDPPRYHQSPGAEVVWDKHKTGFWRKLSTISAESVANTASPVVAGNADSMPYTLTPLDTAAPKDPNPMPPATLPTHVDLAITVIADSDDTAASVRDGVREGVMQAFRDIGLRRANGSGKDGTVNVPVLTGKDTPATARIVLEGCTCSGAAVRCDCGAVIDTSDDCECDCESQDEHDTACDCDCPECECEHDDDCLCPDCEAEQEEMELMIHDAKATVFAHVFFQAMLKTKHDQPVFDASGQATAAVDALVKAGAIFAAADQIEAKL